MRVDKLAYMAPTYESEIRSLLSEQVARALGIQMDASKIHLPARDAHASCRPAQGTSLPSVPAFEQGFVEGVQLIERVRLINGWLLFDFTSEFFSALVLRINEEIPLPDAAADSHAQNRMRVLARHEGSGCPDLPVFHRALLLSLTAHQSPAAYRRAERSAESIFHKIPPRERFALIAQCGAFGGAILRLLRTAGND